MQIKIGKSLEGRDISAFGNFDLEVLQNDQRSEWTLLIGGTHGDESATVPLLENFIESHLKSGMVQDQTLVIPLLNPDGFKQSTRYNARGVDLNRNFPHNWNSQSEEPAGISALSEPEALALHSLILKYQPTKIVTLHWALAELDADGPHSESLLTAMWDALTDKERKIYRKSLSREAKKNSHAEEVNTLYGSLGQWCGYGLIYPSEIRPAMVTLELPYHFEYHPRPSTLPEDHLETVRDHWDNRSAEYLTGVQNHVHRLLAAACRHRNILNGDAPSSQAENSQL